MFILQNRDGKIVRVLPWQWQEQGQRARVVFRYDKNRLELAVGDDFLDLLKRKNISFRDYGEIHIESLEREPFILSGLGSIQRVRSGEELDGLQLEIEKNTASPPENKKILRSVLGACVSFMLIFIIAILLKDKTPSEELVEELKQEVVEMKKRYKAIQPRRVSITTRMISLVPQKKKVIRQRNVSRMGALAVLGKLNAQKKKPGGLDLAKAKTSLGPGLGGGLQGSGGIQKSLYGKGIVSAPLGPGSNIRGAGGYGTKGKGGGKAGYGQLTLIGSSGNTVLPLGRETLEKTGLGKDAIAEVIRRHQGEVRFCYEQGLLKNPKISGRVAVAFVIGSGGGVRRAQVANTTLHSQIVENCILRKLKSWKFPLPRGGVNVAVSYPFLLKRLGQR